MNPFANSYISHKIAKAVHIEPPIPEHAIEVRFSQDLATDVSASLKEGYQRIGTSEFVDRGNRMGVSTDARAHGATVGASLVWFSAIPAKLRAVRRRANGRIDMSCVLADPPASPSPRGYYVVQAVFMRRTS